MNNVIENDDALDANKKLLSNSLGARPLIDPKVGEEYLREHYAKRSYVAFGAPYEEYAPAYRIGYEGRYRYSGKKYDEVEGNLEFDYESARGDSKVEWKVAQHATRDAWHRVEEALPGDYDKDGR